MRHQAEDISRPVADAGNVFNRTIRIRFGNNPAVAIRIAQDYLPIGVKVAQSFRVREETTFAMCNWKTEKRPFRAAMCEWRVIYFHTHCHHVADESQRAVSHERTGQKPGFAQNLKPVARAEHELASVRITDYRAHNGRKARNSAATKVIAIRESTRQHDRIEIIERRFLVPDIFSAQSVESVNRRQAILIAI